MLYEVITILAPHSIFLGHGHQQISPAKGFGNHFLTVSTQPHDCVDQQLHGIDAIAGRGIVVINIRITSYNVCYTKLLRFIPFQGMDFKNRP